MTVQVLRGGIAESIHQVHWALADASGVLLDGEGDAERPVFMRSSAKPFQAMAVIASGAADAFGFSEEETAILGGSHCAEDFHVNAVASILAKSGVPESALRCGAHYPESPAAAKALRDAGLRPSRLHSNCSGKHAGMLALARHIGAPLEGYLQRDHPTQALVFECLGAFCGAEAGSIAYGVDGCGLPAPAVPMRQAATAFARFAASAGVPEPYSSAATTLREAQRRYPKMVQGTNGPDTALLTAAPHLAVKGGAEGYLGVGDARTGRGLVLKVVDGAWRALWPAAVPLILRLGFIDAAAAASMQRFARPPVLNVSGDPVGEIALGA